MPDPIVTPQAGEAQEAPVAQAPATQEIDFGGQKYKLPELVEAYQNYSKIPKEDIERLPALRESDEAYRTMLDLVNANPALQKQIQAEYYKRQGYIPEPKAPEAPTNQGQPASTPAIPPELAERLQQLETAQGDAEMQRQGQEAVSKFPGLLTSSSQLVDAGRKYVEEQAALVAPRGTRKFQDAKDSLAMSLGNLPMTAWPKIVMEKEYTEWLMKQKPSGFGGPNPKVNPPAEGIGSGQPGPTPELREQFKKELASALAKGSDPAQVILGFARKHNINPMEMMGLEPDLARDMQR